MNLWWRNETTLQWQLISFCVNEFTIAGHHPMDVLEHAFFFVACIVKTKTENLVASQNRTFSRQQNFPLCEKYPFSPCAASQCWWLSHIEHFPNGSHPQACPHFCHSLAQLHNIQLFFLFRFFFPRLLHVMAFNISWSFTFQLHTHGRTGTQISIGCTFYSSYDEFAEKYYTSLSRFVVRDGKEKTSF